MTLMWTKNPEADAENYQRMLENQKLPKCIMCGDIIYDEYVYVDNDGCNCEQCLKDKYKIPMDEILAM